MFTTDHTWIVNIVNMREIISTESVVSLLLCNDNITGEPYVALCGKVNILVMTCMMP